MTTPVQVGRLPPDLSRAQFARVAAIARAEAGLCLTEGKRPMISSRLARRLKETGHGDFASYLAFLETGGAQDERRKLVTALTTNVSHFFREAHHFGILETEVLPPLIERARAGGRVRIWSAGCSTGQEPFSIAMIVLSAFPDAGRHDIRILASDIDEAVLDTARRGTYAERLLQDVGDALRRRFFTSEGDDFTVRDSLRGLVTFRRLNLIGAWPIKGRFDAIFCRNVVIYFDAATQAALWPRFHRLLEPGGVLFVGHSERLDPESAQEFVSAGVTAWRRAADAEPRLPNKGTS